MSKYYFGLAGRDDDKALRNIIRSIPMEGSLRIVFQKEPNFFAAERIGTQSLDVLLCRERASHAIVGFGSRSVRRVFVNGRPENIGYLSSLRAIPEVRGGILLPRAYNALRELHAADGKVPFYFTTIFDENETAKQLLTSGRAGLPTYQDIGALNTHIVTLRSFRGNPPDFKGTIVRGSREIIPEIVSFLNMYNAQFQFAPCFEVSDFERGMFSGFVPENFYVARIGASIVGVVGVWDQSSTKQTVVEGYSKTLKYLRPWYNTYAMLIGAPQLPQIGEQIRSLYISFIAINPPEPEVLRMFLHRIYRDWNSSGYEYALFGFNEKDPLGLVLLNVRHRIVKSRMYVVCWEDGRKRVAELENRLPHLEIAIL